MRWLYQPLYLALLLIAAPFLLLTRGAHYVPTLRRRFFGPSGGSEGPESLWVHAVSVGEAGVAAVLARRLPAVGRLTFTTVTPTGQHAAASLLSDRIDLAYLPFDLFWAVRRFLAWARPRGAVLTEGDYWPFLLSSLRRRGVPVYVVNGRLSDRSWGRLRLLPRFITRAWFRPITRFGVQSEQDRERFVRLGVDPADIEVTGNLKFDQQPGDPVPSLEAAIRDLAGGRRILVAGSTMEGEEEQVLRAFDGLAKQAMLLLAPRHPERAPAVRKLAEDEGFQTKMRSEIPAPQPATRGDDESMSHEPRATNHEPRTTSHEPHPEVIPSEGRRPESRDLDAHPEESSSDRSRPVRLGAPHLAQGDQSGKPDVVILDTIGELAGLYALANSAFVGGTLIPTGGHNPLEPAVHAVPIVAGPSMHNFRAIAEAFDDADAWKLVDSAAELADVWRQWLADPDSATGYGARAQRLVNDNRGAIDATLEFLQPLIDRWQTGGDTPTV